MSKEITITLPDGSQKQAPVGISGLEIANMIGAGLAKAAVAFSVNGEQRDLSDVVTHDADISIYTIDSDEGIEINEKVSSDTNQLFDQDINEDEDFEIPAFLRKQKF